MAGLPQQLALELADAAAAEVNLCCDWCGDMIDEGACAFLVCRRPTCGRNAYHQACVETHLRKQKFPPDRLAGFPCLRGHSKKTNVAEPCNGKIDSTHKRIIPKKGKKGNKPVPIVLPPTKPLPAAKAKPAAQPPPAVRSGARTPAAGMQAGMQPGASVKDLTPAQLKAIAAEIRRELNAKNIGAHGNQSCDAPAAAATAKPKPALKVINPGAGAAARLGKAQPQQQTYIPGMEPADPAPANPRGTRRWAAVAQPKPPPTPAPATPAVLHSLQEPKPGGCSINALEASDKGGFITDLDRYNAILRAMGDTLDDEFDDLGGAAVKASAPAVAPAAAAVVVAAPAEEEWEEFDVTAAVVHATDGVAVPAAGLEGFYLTDEQLTMAYLYGPERAGLPAELAPLLQQLYGEYGASGAGGLDAGLLAEQLTPHEADHAAYAEAERVVAEQEAQAAEQERERAAAAVAAAVTQQAMERQAWEQAQLQAQVFQAHVPHLMAMPQMVPALAPAVAPALPWGTVTMPLAAAVPFMVPTLPVATYTPVLAKAVQPVEGTLLSVAEGEDEGDGVDEELYDDILSLCLA